MQEKIIAEVQKVAKLHRDKRFKAFLHATIERFDKEAVHGESLAMFTIRLLYQSKQPPEQPEKQL